MKRVTEAIRKHIKENPVDVFLTPQQLASFFISSPDQEEQQEENTEAVVIRFDKDEDCDEQEPDGVLNFDGDDDELVPFEYLAKVSKQLESEIKEEVEIAFNVLSNFQPAEISCCEHWPKISHALECSLMSPESSIRQMTWKLLYSIAKESSEHLIDVCILISKHLVQVSMRHEDINSWTEDTAYHSNNLVSFLKELPRHWIHDEINKIEILSEIVFKLFSDDWLLSNTSPLDPSWIFSWILHGQRNRLIGWIEKSGLINSIIRRLEKFDNSSSTTSTEKEKNTVIHDFTLACSILSFGESSSVDRNLVRTLIRIAFKFKFPELEEQIIRLSSTKEGSSERVLLCSEGQSVLNSILSLSYSTNIHQVIFSLQIISSFLEQGIKLSKELLSNSLSSSLLLLQKGNISKEFSLTLIANSIKCRSDWIQCCPEICLSLLRNEKLDLEFFNEITSISPFANLFVRFSSNSCLNSDYLLSYLGGATSMEIHKRLECDFINCIKKLNGIEEILYENFKPLLQIILCSNFVLQTIRSSSSSSWNNKPLQQFLLQGFSKSFSKFYNIQIVSLILLDFIIWDFDVLVSLESQKHVSTLLLQHQKECSLNSPTGTTIIDEISLLRNHILQRFLCISGSDVNPIQILNLDNPSLNSIPQEVIIPTTTSAATFLSDSINETFLMIENVLKDKNPFSIGVVNIFDKILRDKANHSLIHLFVSPLLKNISQVPQQVNTTSRRSSKSAKPPFWNTEQGNSELKILSMIVKQFAANNHCKNVELFDISRIRSDFHEMFLTQPRSSRIDWQLIIVYLILEGDLKITCSFKTSFYSSSSSSKMIWSILKQRPSENSMGCLSVCSELLDRILFDKVPEAFGAILQSGISPISIFSHWNNQCFFGILSWNDIVSIFTLILIHGWEFQVFVCVALLKHLSLNNDDVLLTSSANNLLYHFLFNSSSFFSDFDLCSWIPSMISWQSEYSSLSSTLLSLVSKK